MSTNHLSGMNAALVWTIAFFLLPQPDSGQAIAGAQANQPNQTAARKVVLQRGDQRRSGAFDYPAIRQKPNLKWHAKRQAVYFGTPLLANGVLYSGGSDGALYAFDAQTGDVRWSAKRFDAIENAVAIANDLVIGAGQNKQVVALNRNTGREVWAFEASAFVFNAPLVVDEQVFVATHEKLHALELKTGRQSWEVKLGDRPAIVGSPAFAHQTVFVTAGPKLFAFDAASGDERWRVELDQTFYPAALDDRMVFAGNADGHLHAYDQATGEERWKFKSGFGTREDIWSAPAISGDRVYIGSRDQSVYAIDAESGEKVWSFKTAGDAVGDPVISDGLIYVSDSNHVLPAGMRRLHALDAATGKEIWRFEIQSTLLITPALGPGTIFTTITGAVIALE